MTTINTTDDLLRILRTDESIRSEVRREILTEELLAVPGRVDAIQETQTAILADIATLREDFRAMQADIATLREDFRAMQADIKVLREDFRAMQKSLEATQADIKVLREDFRATQADIKVLREDFRAMQKTQDAMLADIATLRDKHEEEHRDMHRFRGNYAIYAATRNRSDLVHLFTRLLGMRYVKIDLLKSAELDTMLDANFDSLTSLGLTNEALNSFPEADVVLRVSERRGSKPSFYIVVEASFTGRASDLERAATRARIVRRATGLDAHAAVAAVKLHPVVEGRVYRDPAEYMRAPEEDSVFWYPITEEHMEPPPPR